VSKFSRWGGKSPQPTSSPPCSLSSPSLPSLLADIARTRTPSSFLLNNVGSTSPPVSSDPLLMLPLASYSHLLLRLPIPLGSTRPHLPQAVLRLPRTIYRSFRTPVEDQHGSEGDQCQEEEGGEGACRSDQEEGKSRFVSSHPVFLPSFLSADIVPFELLPQNRRRLRSHPSASAQACMSFHKSLPSLESKFVHLSSPSDSPLSLFRLSHVS